jgi:hypothetical protein
MVALMDKRDRLKANALRKRKEQAPRIKRFRDLPDARINDKLVVKLEKGFWPLLRFKGYYQARQGKWKRVKK